MSDSATALCVGDIHTGPVTSVKRFGVFVAVGDIQGLVDAWWLQENVETWPVLGATLSVRIEKVHDDGKLTLSIVQ